MEKIILSQRAEIKKRDLYFQMIRGLSICAVLLIHCYSTSRSNFENYFLILIRNLENFAVGIFIFMAGYFAKPNDHEGGWLRLKKLIIPFLLWGLFFEITSRNFNPLKMAYHIICGRSSGQMYFILVLLELIIITPLLHKAMESRKWSIFILAITPLYLIAFSILHYHYIQSSDWIGRDFAAWITYYYIGMLIQKYGWKRKRNVCLLALFMLAYGLSVLEGIYALHVMGTINIAVSQLKLSCMFYIISVIFLTMNNRKTLTKPFQKGLAYIGDRSYGVFYVHTFILRCVTWILKRTGLIDSLSIPMIQVIQFITVLALSLLTIWLARQIDRNGKYCKLIGF